MTTEKTVPEATHPEPAPAPYPAGENAATEEAAEPIGERYHAASDIQILVLDDDQMICRLIRTALSHFNFSVYTASEARTIEKFIKKGPYHLVIMDYMIPGVQFEQLLDLVQQEHPNASVIVVTAFPTLDHALQCLRARTHDYLPKPFEVAALNRTVLRCLESKGLLRLSEDALRDMVGRAVRERRKALKLTLADLAEQTGVSVGYLSQIELGKNSASIETLYKIALGLHIRLAELFQDIHPHV